MACQPPSAMDLLKPKNSLRGTTASVLGIVATFVMLGLLGWLYFPQVLTYLDGKYYQSFWMSHQPTYTSVLIPS